MKKNNSSNQTHLESEMFLFGLIIGAIPKSFEFLKKTFKKIKKNKKSRE